MHGMNKMFSLGVFMDLKKAFNTVNQKILIEKFNIMKLEELHLSS